MFNTQAASICLLSLSIVSFGQIMQDNWPCVLIAMAGGIFLSLGNLSTQYAWAFVGLSVTEVITSSIAVVIGEYYYCKYLKILKCLVTEICSSNLKQWYFKLTSFFLFFT